MPQTAQPDDALTHAAAAPDAAALLRRGLAAALQDLGAGRADLHAAVSLQQTAGDPRAVLLANAALVLCIGIADDDYSGFETAVKGVLASAGLIDTLGDPGDRLLARAAALTAGRFVALDNPQLTTQATALAPCLGDETIAAPLRCCAGLELMGFYRERNDLEGVLFIELALRPLRADPTVGARLTDEVHHLLVQSLYECEAPARAAALRSQRLALGRPILAPIELKLLLLDAQIALGSAQGEAGAAALARAEPLLDPRAPRPAGWWHLLRSRLDLLEGRYRPALTHARLALRLSSASHLPERWMGVTVMQEGQVLMATGGYLLALPFFERAGRAASGTQARFCHCLAHLARALHHFGTAEMANGRLELSRGLAMARELAWLNFFRACPPVAAAVCTLALEHEVEAHFVHEVIAARGLLASRNDLAVWPWPIRVRTLGGLRIEVDGQALVFKGKVARKPLELLLFIIACGGSDVSANSVVFALWPELDGDKARAAFNAALHRLRRLLGRVDGVLLDHGRLSLDPRCVWVDCLAFEEQADRVSAPAAAAATGAAALPSQSMRLAAERAQALYSGAFLHDTDDAAWQTTYRARLAAKFKRVVRQRAQDALQRGDGAAARAVLERGLEFDPQAEDLARELMRLAADSGELATALLVFERCRSAIAHGLGARPSPATLELLARIRSALAS